MSTELTLADVSDDAEASRKVHVTAARNITGYSSDLADHYGRKQGRLNAAFRGESSTPQVCTVLALTNHGETVGGVVLEPGDPTELINQGHRKAGLLWAQHHWALSALFVTDEYRGCGLARRMLDEAFMTALHARVRFIDGFVDDKNRSVGFYRKVDAQVMPHNTGLPPRPPANLNLTHVPGIDGHWFRFDLWDHLGHMMFCSRCQDPLRFDRVADQMRCTRCGPPRKS